MAQQIGDLYVQFRSNAPQFQRQLGGVGKTTTSLKSKLGSFARALTPVNLGITGIGIAIAGLTKESIKLEKSLDQTNTILNLSDSQLQKYKKSLQEMAIESGTASIELTKGLYEAVSAGQEVGESLEFTKKANQLAIVGFTGTSQSIDLLTSIMNTYGDAAGNVTEISNKLLEAQNKGKLKIQELASSLAGATSIGGNLGVTLDDILAGLVTITKQGFNTARATTQLRRLFTELSNSGSDLSEVFNQLTGKSFRQYISDGGNLQQATQLIGKYAKETGREITDFTGRIEAGTAIMALAGENSEEYAKQLKNIQNTTVDVGKKSKEVTDNVAGEWKKLLETIKTDYDILYETFLQNPLKITIKTVREAITPEKNKTTPSKTGNVGDTLYLQDVLLSGLAGRSSITRTGESKYYDYDKGTGDLFVSGEMEAYKEGLEETEESFRKVAEALESANKQAEKYGKLAETVDLTGTKLELLKDTFDLTEEQMKKVSDKAKDLGFDIIYMDLKDVKSIVKELDFKTPVEQAIEKVNEMKKTTEEAKKIDFSDVINKAKEMGVSTNGLAKGTEYYNQALEGNSDSLEKIKNLVETINALYKDYNKALKEQANQIYFNETINKQIEELQQKSKEHQLKIYNDLYNNTVKYFNDIATYTDKALSSENLNAGDISLISDLYSQATKQATKNMTKKEQSEVERSSKQAADSLKNLTTENKGFSKETLKLIDDTNDLANAFSNLGSTMNSDFFSSMGSLTQNAAGVAGGLATVSAAGGVGSLAGAAGALGAAGAAIGIAATLLSDDSPIYGGIDASQYQTQEEATETFANAVETFAETVSDMDFSKITEFMQYTQKAATMSTLGITSHYEALYKKKLGIKYKVGSKTVERANISQIQSYLEDQGVLMTANQIQSLVDKYTQVDASGTSQHAYIDEAGLLNEINNLVKAVQDELRGEIAENLGIDASDISSSIIDAVSDGNVKQTLQKEFSDALQTAMLQSFGLTDLYQAFSNNMVDEIVDKIGGVDFGTDLLEYYTENLSNYSFDRQLEIISKYTNQIYKIFDELNIQIADTTTEIIDSMNIFDQLNIAGLGTIDITDPYQIGFKNIWNQFVGWLPDAKKTLADAGWTSDLLSKLNIDISDAFTTGQSYEEAKKALEEIFNSIQSEIKENIMEALSIEQGDITSTVISGFTSGDVESALMSQFSTAMQTAMLQSFGLTELYKAFGENVYKQIVGTIAGADFNFSADDLSGLTLEEQAKLIASYTDKLSEYMQKLGISLDTNTSSTNSLNSTLSSENLPEGSKLAARIFEASAGAGTVVTNTAGNQQYFDFSGANFSGSGVTEATVKEIVIETYGQARAVN